MFPPVLYPNRGTLARGAGAGPSGPALIQQATGRENAASLEVGLASLTNGSAIVVCVTHKDTVNVSEVRSGPDNKFSLVKATSEHVDGVAIEIWYSTNTTGDGGETTIQIFLDSAGRVCANVSEWSGLNDAPPEDKGGKFHPSDPTPSVNPVVPVSMKNLIVGCGAWTHDAYASGPTDSFVRMTHVDAEGESYQESAYLIQSLDAAAGFMWGLSTAQPWVTASVVFGAP